jgi:hypothetical protein
VTMRAAALSALVAVLLALIAAGCGEAGRQPGDGSVAASHARSARSHQQRDRDNDGDNNTDDQHVLGFGRPADTGESQAIGALIANYYAAAAAMDGAKACRLLAPFVAEAVVERHGHVQALRGKTCAAVISRLFKLNHGDLTTKRATLKVMRIGVEGNRSLIAVEFPTIPEMRQLSARRSNGRWGMLSLLDGIVE